MKASEDVPDVFQEKEITINSLAEDEKLEVHIEDKLKEMELFFSKEFDETIVPFDL